MPVKLNDGDMKAFAAAIRAMYPSEVGVLRDGDKNKYAKFRNDPVGYITRVLRIRLSPQQIQVCEALMKPPYRVIVVSANNIGKTHTAGALINWFYDCYNPGVCITTAPSDRDVRDVMWKEVRVQRRTRHDFKGPAVPEMGDAPDHYAKGYTGTTPEAFHGRHDKHLFFVVDEGTAIQSFVFEGISSMFKANGNHFWLTMLNPIDTTSAVYAEAESGNYTIVRLNALDHPNIDRGLRGLPIEIDGAVDLHQVDDWIKKWFEEVPIEDRRPGDILWPPPDYMRVPSVLTRVSTDGRQRCLRPGMEGQARVLGLWPSSSDGQVWSDFAWQLAMRALPQQKKMELTWESLPEIGCDTAGGGGDKTEIVIQSGGIALEHKVGSGWEPSRIQHILMETAKKWIGVYNQNRPKDMPFLDEFSVPIRVDDANIGYAIVDYMRNEGYSIKGVSSGTVAKAQNKYILMRDQAWFDVVDAAKAGHIDFSRLSQKSLVELKRQAMAVRWLAVPGGRRIIVKKEETRKVIGRSPDGMDALNLAFMPAEWAEAPTTFSQTNGRR